MQGKIKKNISLPVAILTIILLGFAVYANSLNNKFVWDDHFLVADNPLIRGWSSVPVIMTENVGCGPKGAYALYRPVQIMSYLIDYSAWRCDVRGYHLTNIILHIFTALALFRLINALFRDRMLSFFTALLFVAHPVHTEAVTYIAGRADVLAGLFLLLSLTFYIKGRYAAAVPAYILALFSKEYSIVLPFLILLYHGVFRVRIKEPSRIRVLTLITIAYLALRFIVSRPLAGSLSFAGSCLMRVPGFFAALANYARILFLPAGLHMEYGSGLFGFGDPRAVLGILITVALIMLWFKRRESDVVRFAVPWFFLTILPVSNIYPMNAYMAEHWLYLPSISFFLMLGAGINSLYRSLSHRAAAILALGILVAGYSYLAVTQNFYWADPVEFYKTTIRYTPDSARLYSNLGTEYSRMGYGSAAIASYRKAISLDPAYTIAYNNMGTEYRNKGDLGTAKRLYEKAIALSPGYADPCYNLGLLYQSSGEDDLAISCYRKAIELSPRYAEAYNNLGNIYRDRKKDAGEALEIYEKAVEMNGNCRILYLNMADIYLKAGRKERALAALENVVRLDPDNVDARNIIGNIYSSMGRRGKAIASYEAAVRIKPDSADSLNNLGTELGLAGRTAEALKLFEKALAIDPDNAAAGRNLKLAREAMDRCKGI